VSSQLVAQASCNVTVVRARPPGEALSDRVATPEQ